jgi:iduronate 2-sulfatase
VTEEEEQAHALMDTQIADQAIAFLEDQDIDGAQPFFLAVGLEKPHLPFTFPKRFLEHYENLPSTDAYPENPYPPVDMPASAWCTAGELRSYNDIGQDANFTGRINDPILDVDNTIDLRKAYFAAVSHMDEEFGRILNRLESLGLAQSTVVVMVGDHGFQLGEHAAWVKHSNFKLATEVPLIIHAPSFSTDPPRAVVEMVEAVDIYPTITELAGVPAPPLCPESNLDIALCTEGFSLVPLMAGEAPSNWKVASFSQYPRSVNGEAIAIMGYNMITKNYRCTEWVDFDRQSNTTDWKMTKAEGQGVELYDLVLDPDENKNVAYEQAYGDIAADLSTTLHLQWRQFIPSL